MASSKVEETREPASEIPIPSLSGKLTETVCLEFSEQKTERVETQVYIHLQKYILEEIEIKIMLIVRSTIFVFLVMNVLAKIINIIV